jgi:bidirectional [NiFe] hydrogenase diaphorase subunit
MEINIDGIRFDAPEGYTVLDAAKFLGIRIPTLCYHEGLSPWGGCRLCIVELVNGNDSKIVTSCTYQVTNGLVVRTSSERIINARKMVLELLISQCPTSKTLQDLASEMGLNRVRFSAKWENCIYCGLCVRMCNEQMMASAIGFRGRGNKLKITTPFDENSEVCRKCGGCIYICPACNLRCPGPANGNILCGSCSQYLTLNNCQIN